MFLLLLVLSHAINRQHIRNAYFQGRSANVQGTQSLISGENNIVLMSGVEPKSLISVMDIGDAVSRSFWVGRLNTNKATSQAEDLPSSDFLLFNFGVDRSTYEALPSKEALSQMSMAALNIPFHPSDPVSIVTSALTGVVPGTHGIVSESWVERGSPVEAFSTARRFPSVVGVVNLMHDEYDDLQITAAASNRVLSFALSEGTALSSFVKDDVFVGPKQALTFNWAQVEEALTTDEAWTPLSEQVATLDITDANNKIFLMEMEYLNRLQRSFEYNFNGKFEIYNVATTSMENMPKTDAVLTIFGSMLDRCVAAYNAAYPQGLAQVAFIETPQMAPHDDEMIEAKLSNSRSLSPAQFQEICQEDDVICLMANDDLPGTEQTTYQCRVWIMFTCLIFVWSFSCFFCQMRYEDDSLLFTKWNRET